MKTIKGIRQKISLQFSQRREEVDALVFGPLAIHKTPAVKTNCYTLTHVPTGKLIAFLYGYQYAKKVSQLMAAGMRWDIRDIGEFSLEERSKLYRSLQIARGGCLGVTDPEEALEELEGFLDT